MKGVLDACIRNVLGPLRYPRSLYRVSHGNLGPLRYPSTACHSVDEEAVEDVVADVDEVVVVPMVQGRRVNVHRRIKI